MSAAPSTQNTVDRGGQLTAGRDLFHGNQFVINGTGNIVIGPSGTAHPQPEPVPKRVFDVPFPRDRDHFIPRLELFKQLDKAFGDGKTAILCGLGGTGKSQIAIEYAYRFKERFDDYYVIWIYAASIESANASCREACRTLNLLDHNVPNPNPSYWEILGDWLTKDSGHSSGKKWLLVLDNLDSLSTLQKNTSQGVSRSDAINDYKTLVEYLPANRCRDQQILVTSRLTNVAILDCKSIPVDIFSPEESLNLLKSKLVGDHRWPAILFDWEVQAETIKALLEELNYVPLAISQAAALLLETPMSPEDLLSALRQPEEGAAEYFMEELSDTRRQPGSPNSVYKTWKLSFDQIKNEQPLAAEILYILVMYANKQIPRFVLSGFRGKSELAVRRALGTIRGFSLAELNTKTEMIYIHSLVASSVRYWLQTDHEFNRYAHDALVVLEKSVPRYTWAGEADFATQISRFLSLQPHVVTLLERSVNHTSDPVVWSNLLLKRTKWYAHEGLYSAALINAKQIVDVFRVTNEADAGILLEAQCMLSISLFSLRQYVAADKVLTEALRDTSVNESNNIILRAKNFHVQVLARQLKFEDAEKLCLELLALYSSLDGVDELQTLRALSQFGYVMRLKGCVEDARQTFKYLLARLEQCYPDAKFEVVDARRQFAWTLVLQGDYVEAHRLLASVLHDAENIHVFPKAFGLWTILCLARSHWYQGLLEEAMRFYRKLVQEGSSTLGQSHPEVSVWSAELRSVEAKHTPTQHLDTFPETQDRSASPCQPTTESWSAIDLAILVHRSFDSSTKSPAMPTEPCLGRREPSHCDSSSTATDGKHFRSALTAMGIPSGLSTTENIQPEKNKPKK